jgi:hypothetical protein
LGILSRRKPRERERALVVQMEWGSECVILRGAQQGSGCVLLVCGEVNCLFSKPLCFFRGSVSCRPIYQAVIRKLFLHMFYYSAAGHVK